jgi:hypothetical protein
MGCIIDWTGVLKAPQIAGGRREKLLAVSGRKVALLASGSLRFLRQGF